MNMVLDDGTKYTIDRCTDDGGQDVFIKVKFNRPFWFRGYGFVMGNDSEGRDPRRWSVKADDCMGKITHFTDEEVERTERHNSYMYGELERECNYKFAMKFPCFTDEVKFTIHEVRGGEWEWCFSLSQIKFYG